MQLIPLSSGTRLLPVAGHVWRSQGTAEITQIPKSSRATAATTKGQTGRRLILCHPTSRSRRSASGCHSQGALRSVNSSVLLVPKLYLHHVCSDPQVTLLLLLTNCLCVRCPAVQTKLCVRVCVCTYKAAMGAPWRAR